MVASEIHPSLEGMDGLDPRAQPAITTSDVGVAQDDDGVDAAKLIRQPHVTPTRDVTSPG